MKDIDSYQLWTSSTVSNPDVGALYFTLGLAGETGEVVEKIKKAVRRKLDPDALPQADREELAKEIGDVFWYAARLAGRLGFKLSEVLQMNVDKLNGRKERGTLNGSGDNR